MIIRIHIDSNDINHDLSDDNVNNNEQTKCADEAVVSDQVFNWFNWQEDLLLVDDETIQEDDATSKQGVWLEEEAVLVVAQDVMTNLAKEHVYEDDHEHCFPYSSCCKCTNCDDDCLKIWHSLGRILEQWNTSYTYQEGIDEHDYLVENEQGCEINIFVLADDICELFVGIVIENELQDLIDIC